MAANWRVAIVMGGVFIAFGMGAAESEKETVRLKPFAVVKPARENVEQTKYVNLAISPDGKRLYALARLYGKVKREFIKTPSGLTEVARNLAPPSSLECWEFTESGARQSWSVDLQYVPTPGIRSLALSPDGKVLALSQIESVELRETKAGTMVKKLTTDGEKFSRSVTGLSFTRDGRWLAGVYGTGERQWTHVWDVTSGATVRSWNVSGPGEGEESVTFRCARFAPDRETLGTAGYSSGILFWNVKTGKVNSWRLTEETLLQTPVIYELEVAQVAEKTYWITSHGNWEETPRGLGFSGQAVGAIQVRDGSGKVLYTRQLDGAALAIAVSPDGRWFAGAEFACSWRRIRLNPTFLLLGIEQTEKPSVVRLWETETGKNLAVLEGHEKGVTDVVIAPDGSWLASCSTDGTIRLWRVPEQVRQAGKK